MKNILLAFVFYLPIVSFGCETTKLSEVCMASYSKTRAVAFFSFPKREMWEWGKNSYPDRYEYSWISEPGKCEKGKFVGSGVSFGMGIKGIDRNYPFGKKGSMHELLASADRSIFFKKTPMKNRLLASGDGVAFKIHEPDYISIQPIDQKSVSTILNKNNTHMRMEYKSPIDMESYKCVVKIEHLNLR